ncbi:MAG TPA: Dabb family protein [Candidatus Agrococcus pullicola]|uniref:Dabb family protein n=1 Tax=Candidatus Agrococcus pullicola TaxID=2838429 RepID=A0A9D2CAE3_9MICO|nr:Dabb family protein [Candidatus Agrococcus pullicola]
MRFTIRPEVPKETVDAIVAGMSAQSSTSDSDGLFGRDVGGEFQFAAVSRFESLEQYEAMMNDPEHLEMDRMGLPLISRFVSFDIVDDFDPAVVDEIHQIHQRRFDAHPDLVELIDTLDEYQGSAAPGKHAR